jgi:type IV pilus assembly protein PilA
MLKQVQKGFTLIELMIVVAIIGILAAIAIPAYQNYTIRAQVTEGMSLAGTLQTGIGEFFAENGTFPLCVSTIAAPAAGCVNTTATGTGKYVNSVTITTGTVVVTFSSAAPYAANAKLGVAGANTLTFVPYVTANNDIVWKCGTALAPTGGGAVIGTGVTAVATTVPVQYLPTSCHS